jgi:hypothetical protein
VRVQQSQSEASRSTQPGRHERIVDVTESEARTAVYTASGPIREGKAVCEREGTRVNNRRKEESAQTHHSGMTRHCHAIVGIVAAIAR